MTTVLMSNGLYNELISWLNTLVEYGGPVSKKPETVNRLFIHVYVDSGVAMGVVCFDVREYPLSNIPQESVLAFTSILKR